jgi:hypothetical protein
MEIHCTLCMEITTLNLQIDVIKQKFISIVKVKTCVNPLIKTMSFITNEKDLHGLFN